MIFNQPIDFKKRFLSNPHSGFNRTGFIFKKPPHHSQIEVNCLPQPKSTPRQIHTSNPESIETKCTNFMKQYIEKLKKQRKRKNKKILQSNPRHNFCNQQFYNQQHQNPPSFVILERVEKKDQWYKGNPNPYGTFRKQYRTAQIIEQIKNPSSYSNRLQKQTLGSHQLYRQNQLLANIFDRSNTKMSKRLSPLLVNQSKKKHHDPAAKFLLQPWNDKKKEIDVSSITFDDLYQ